MEVECLATRYGLPFFVVTEGASMTRNKDCKAVENARISHIRWEQENGIDSDEDWLAGN